MSEEMEFREVICPYCGHAQDEERYSDSFVCENCDKIYEDYFYDEALKDTDAD